MEPAFLSFLEAVRRGSGQVDPGYAGWLMPRDPQESAILDASSAVRRVRLSGWVRDDLSDRIMELMDRASSTKDRDRLAELARYYLRPVGAKNLVASRATLSNWRRDAARLIAVELAAPHATGLTLYLDGVPRKGERFGLDSLARDPAVSWILRLEAQEREVALHRGLADAANEARAKADPRMLIGVALISFRLIPEINPEPTRDYDGTPLTGMDGRKFTRSRLALPLVLLCLHRAAVIARRPGHPHDRRAEFTVGHRLVQPAHPSPAQPAPLVGLDTEVTFDRERFDEGVAHAWKVISTAIARPILAALTRHAALASGMLTDRQHQDLALLSVAIARRHSDRRALDIDLHRPAFRGDSGDSVRFQLRFRRERLMLASHHRPGVDWRPELTRMSDLLLVRRLLLPADESRRMEKVQLHLHQGILLRQARELTAGGRPMDIAPTAVADGQIRCAIRAIEEMIASVSRSFRIADEDADQITAVNAHRRKTEVDGVVHLLSCMSKPDILANARRLRRDLNRLDDVYSEQLSGLRADVHVLWLLAMADQAIRHHEHEQARHYLTAAVEQLPDGIPHLAIRSANIAASIGDADLAKHLVERVPDGHTWPSYLKYLVTRLR
ncbi:MAG: hypothetical protein ACRCYQ_02265 [Nocardioides sp.]